MEIAKCFLIKKRPELVRNEAHENIFYERSDRPFIDNGASVGKRLRSY